MTNERYADFGGYGTRYLEAGDPTATTLLLLHDGAWGGSSSVTWGGVIPFLADQGFHVLAPDMLGFGASDKVVFFDRAPVTPRIAHVKAMLRALVPGDAVHLVGTSFGGSAALRWLAADETGLLSVTSLAGTGGPWRTQLSSDGLRDWDGTREDMERLVELLIDRGPEFERSVDERLHWASVPGHYRSVAAVGVPLPAPLASVAAREADAWPDQLAGTTTPLHLIAGTRDPLLETDWPERITIVRPDALITRIDTRHSPNLDEPERMARVLADGLARLSSPGQKLS